jgi:hypothetical protein
MAETEADSGGYPSLVYSNYTLALLWGVYVSNQWSRYILNYLYAISSDDSTYSISEVDMIAFFVFIVYLTIFLVGM